MSTLPFIREPIRANPLPDENDVIARAQSLLTRDGKVGPVLSYADALRVLSPAEPASAASALADTPNAAPSGEQVDGMNCKTEHGRIVELMVDGKDVFAELAPF